MGRKTFWALTACLAAAVVAMWAVAALYSPLNSDAGHYLSLAGHVLAGKVPYIDFPSAYAPGSYYVFSLIGEDGLASAVWSRAFLFAVHVLNAVLLFGVLRTLGHAAPPSAFLACVFALWVYAADGTAIVVEPLQNLFLLSALLAVLRLPGLAGAFVGGCLAGLALMMKQYALLSVPVLAAAAAAPWWWREAPPEGGRARWLGAAVFALGLPLPFLVFCVATGNDILETFRHVATFGGNAADYAGLKYNAHQAFITLTSGMRGQSLVVLVALIGLLSVYLRPSRRALLLLTLFLLNVLPLVFVRGYGHYVQLAAPWGICLAAEFARAAGAGFGDPKRGARLVALLVALPVLPIFAYNAVPTFRDMQQDRLGRQTDLAREIVARLPERDGVLVINAPWLYVLTQVRAPLLYYGFVLGAEGNDERLAAAKHVVLMPFRRFDQVEARDWIEAAGFVSFATLEWRGKPVTLFRRES